MRRKTIRCEFVFGLWECWSEQQKQYELQFQRRKPIIFDFCEAAHFAEICVAGILVVACHLRWHAFHPQQNSYCHLWRSPHTPEVLTSSIPRTFLAIPRVFSRAVDARTAPWHKNKNTLAHIVGKNPLQVTLHRKAQVDVSYGSFGVVDACQTT